MGTIPPFLDSPLQSRTQTREKARSTQNHEIKSKVPMGTRSTNPDLGSGRCTESRVAWLRVKTVGYLSGVKPQLYSCTSHVALGKSLRFAGLSFLIQKMGIRTASVLYNCCEGQVKLIDVENTAECLAHNKLYISINQYFNIYISLWTRLCTYIISFIPHNGPFNQVLFLCFLLFFSFFFQYTFQFFTTSFLWNSTLTSLL